MALEEGDGEAAQRQIARHPAAVHAASYDGDVADRVRGPVVDPHGRDLDA